MASIEHLPLEILQNIIALTIPPTASHSQYKFWLRPYTACRTLLSHAKATFCRLSTMQVGIVPRKQNLGDAQVIKHWGSIAAHFHTYNVHMKATTSEEASIVLKPLAEMLEQVTNINIIYIMQYGTVKGPHLSKVLRDDVREKIEAMLEKAEARLGRPIERKIEYGYRGPSMAGQVVRFHGQIDWRPTKNVNL